MVNGLLLKRVQLKWPSASRTRNELLEVFDFPVQRHNMCPFLPLHSAGKRRTRRIRNLLWSHDGSAWDDPRYLQIELFPFCVASGRRLVSVRLEKLIFIIAGVFCITFKRFIFCFFVFCNLISSLLISFKLLPCLLISHIPLLSQFIHYFGLWLLTFQLQTPLKPLRHIEQPVLIPMEMPGGLCHSLCLLLLHLARFHEWGAFNHSIETRPA